MDGSDLTVMPTASGWLAGVTVLVVGIVLGWLAGRLIKAILKARGRHPDASASVFGSLTRWLTWLITLLIALTVVFPSIRPVNALGGLGILSIAAGIAFQTILSDMFAGLVILANKTFQPGDQISVERIAGTVTAIKLASTTLTTYDGRLVTLPNGLIHAKPLTVQTGFAQVRSSIDVTLSSQADLRQAAEVAAAAMRTVSRVAQEPAPQALIREFGSGSVILELRFWSGSTNLETRLAQHDVVISVIEAFGAERIAKKSDVLVVDLRQEAA